MADIEKTFASLGGEFLTPYPLMAEKARNVRAYLFDWDGVFNDGVKYGDSGSLFSEVEAMGVNLLRFGHWLRLGTFPLIGIITGESNAAALKLAQREHFEVVYLKFKDKTEALNHLTKQFGIRATEVVFVYDDVLDLSLASKADLRFMVRRTASPLLTQYVRTNRLADYLTAHGGGNHAVREVCELLLGMTGMYDTVVSKRAAFDGQYSKYFTQRNTLATQFFVREAQGIVNGSPSPA